MQNHYHNIIDTKKLWPYSISIHCQSGSSDAAWQPHTASKYIHGTIHAIRVDGMHPLPVIMPKQTCHICKQIHTATHLMLYTDYY